MEELIKLAKEYSASMQGTGEDAVRQSADRLVYINTSIKELIAEQREEADRFESLLFKAMNRRMLG